MWYKVTYVVPGDNTQAEYVNTDLIYADYYKTQATNGAGMVTDFFQNHSVNPTDTFAKVLNVQRSQPCDTARVDLTIEDARYIQNILFKAEPEGSDAIRAIIKKAVDDSWSTDWELSKTKQTATGRS